MPYFYRFAGARRQEFAVRAEGQSNGTLEKSQGNKSRLKLRSNLGKVLEPLEAYGSLRCRERLKIFQSAELFKTVRGHLRAVDIKLHQLGQAAEMLQAAVGDG